MVIFFEIFFTLFSAKHDITISIFMYFLSWSYELCLSKFLWYPSSIVQIYVVDSLDRERIGRAKAEFQVYILEWLIFPVQLALFNLIIIFFQAIIRDPFMLNAVILVFANKQDMVRISVNLLRSNLDFWDGNVLPSLHVPWHEDGPQFVYLPSLVLLWEKDGYTDLECHILKFWTRSWQLGCASEVIFWMKMADDGTCLKYDCTWNNGKLLFYIYTTTIRRTRLPYMRM